MLFVFFVHFVASLAAEKLTRGEKLCSLEPLCGSTCDRTCENTCGCDDDGALVFGGKCVPSDFCHGDSFYNKTQCVDDDGTHASCPDMASIHDIIKHFTSYDFRIDVRSEEEWAQGHANISIHTPGLSATAASQYLDKIGGLENKSLLVYCRGGSRAFAASRNLMKYGFRKVISFYNGGFPNLKISIIRDSFKGKNHPTKAFCYITGTSNICPQPLPLSHIKDGSDLKTLGEKVFLVDVRPAQKYPESLSNAQRVSTVKLSKFLLKTPIDATLVFFCQKGISSFLASKKARAIGWSGTIYWIDNGGYPELKDIPGIETV